MHNNRLLCGPEFVFSDSHMNLVLLLRFNDVGKFLSVFNDMVILGPWRCYIIGRT